MNRLNSPIDKYIESALQFAPRGAEVEAVMKVLRDVGLDAYYAERPLEQLESEYGRPGCEWPVDTGLRYGMCGRGGASKYSDYRISLCWQHEDLVISTTLHALRKGGGRWGDEAIAALAERVFSNPDFTRRRHWADAIDREIIRRIEERDFGPTPEVADAFKKLIDQLIEVRWAA